MTHLRMGVVVLALAASAAAQTAPPGPAAVTVELRPLWGDHYRPGRFLPLQVAVQAQQAVRGQLELRADGGATTVFDLDLPAGGRWGVVTAVTAHGSAPRVQAFFGGAGPALATTTWRRPPRGVALVGTLPGPGGHAHPALEAAVAGRAAQRWAGAIAPGDPLDYDVLDCCVAGRLGPEQLDAGAARALVAWVRAGGRLVLADPAVLQRVPALDRALFEQVEPGEAVAASIPGLPEHFADALRRRGLGIADVVYDAGRRPHHVRFRAGRGAGALLLAPLDTAPARAAFDRLLADLAGAGDESVPTLAPRVVGAFPGPAAGGWPRTALACCLLGLPVLAWWIGRAARPGLAAAVAASLVAAWLAAGAMSPVAEVVPVRRTGAAPVWLLHLSAARGAVCAIVAPPGARVRPLLQQVGQAGNPQGRWFPALARLEPAPLQRGTRAAWELRGGTPEPVRLTGRMAAGRLLVSNESGVGLTGCVLAWHGQLLDLGAIEAGGVRNVVLPASLPGPLATLTRIAGRTGSRAARALRAVFYRVPAGTPLLLALAPGVPGDGPVVEGASNVVHPPVLVAPVTGAR